MVHSLSLMSGCKSWPLVCRLTPNHDQMTTLLHGLLPISPTDMPFDLEGREKGIVSL
jgi:hypothetical protein